MMQVENISTPDNSYAWQPVLCPDANVDDENEPDYNVTNLQDLLATVVHFLHINLFYCINLFYNDWTVFFCHPIDTLFTLFFAPVISFLFVAVAMVLWLFSPSRLSKDSTLTKALGEFTGITVTKQQVEAGLTQMQDSKLALEYDRDISRTLLFFSTVMYKTHKERQEYINTTLEDNNRVAYYAVRDGMVGPICGVFVVEAANLIIVSFQGTPALSVNQWLLDSTFNKIDANSYLYGAVHAGFYQVLFQRKEDTQVTYWNVMRKISEITSGSDNKYRLWVTGHSLGGAIASLFFARVRDSPDLPNHMKVAGAYTYGAPRVGNLQFRNAYTSGAERGKPRIKATMIRVTNANDPIPNFPMGTDNPSDLAVYARASGLNLFDYCHIGTHEPLHYSTSQLPDQPLDFPVARFGSLARYHAYHFLLAFRPMRVWDWVLSWRDLAPTMTRLVNAGVPLPIAFFPCFAVQFICMANHMPYSYLSNMENYRTLEEASAINTGWKESAMYKYTKKVEEDTARMRRDDEEEDEIGHRLRVEQRIINSGALKPTTATPPPSPSLRLPPTA